MNLRDLDDKTLYENTLMHAKSENREMMATILHLTEMERRQLFADYGFDSLYDCVRKMGYSEGSAVRRIGAIRLLAVMPDAEQKLRDGALNLTNVAMMMTFINKTGKPLAEVLPLIENKTTYGAARALKGLDPNPMPKEKKKPIDSENSEISMVESKELEANIKRLREIWSHINPNMSMAEIFLRTTEIALNKIDPHRKAPTARMSKLEQERELFREQRGCQWDTDGQKCGSTHLLQKDHIIPRAFGGADTADNWQVLCFAHNQLKARRQLGKETMAPYMRH